MNNITMRKGKVTLLAITFVLSASYYLYTKTSHTNGVGTAIRSLETDLAVIRVRDGGKHSSKTTQPMSVTERGQSKFPETFGNISAGDINNGQGKVVQSEIPSIKPISGGKTRYFIYHCSKQFQRCGGWADRFKGIAIGYLISRVTNRTFGISITHPPCHLHRYLLPNHVAWNITISHLVSNSSNKKAGFYRKTDDTSFYKSIHAIDFDKMFKEDVVYFQANLDYMDKFKQNPRYVSQNAWMANLTRDQVYAKLYRHLFTVSPDIQSKLASFLKVARPTPSHKLVCAHIRSQYTKPRGISEEGILKVWKFLGQYNDSEKYRIFVATDADNIRRQARVHLGNVIDNNGLLVHIDESKNKTHVCEGMQKVILDQNILINCDVLLLTFSGFSRMAAYLRQKDSGLFCHVKNEIIPCSMRNLKELYNVLG